MKKIKFSIITICLNEQERISKTLKSICTQTYTDFEHIIQDGGSTDNTLSVVKGMQGFYKANQLKIYSESDAGLYDAMNRAVRKASGEYICFINSGDTLLDQNTLLNIANMMTKYPEMDWYYGKCIVVFPNGDEYIQMPVSIENINGLDLTDKLKKEHLKLNHQSIFAKKSCLEEFPFDTKYKLRAELKWYYDCLLSKKRVKAVDFAVCKYSFGGISERCSSMPVHAREVKQILQEKGLLSDELKSMLPKEDDYCESYKNIYNLWLALLQAGGSIEKYLLSKSVNKIAIYGCAELGTHLVNELKRSSIDIKCIIDRDSKTPYSGIEIIRPEDFCGEVDLVIVTAIVHFPEIYDYMKKLTDCRIVSLEEVLEQAWL